MNKRKLLRLLLLAGAAVLLLAAYLIWSALSSRPKDAGETVLFQANDIVEIQSSFAGEEQVFTKERGVWVLKSDAAFPLNTAYIGDMEEALSNLVATGKLESEDLSEYGLVVPAFEITAITASGSEFTCAVGNENNTADVVYLRTGGSVYTVDIGFSRRFCHTLLEMVEKNPYINACTLEVLGVPVDMGQVKLGAYVIAGITDHITPWRGCYGTARLFGPESTFVLANAGHLQSLINPPGAPKSYFFATPATVEDADE